MVATKIPFDIEAAGPVAIQRYEYLLQKNSPRMAEMLALKSPPRCNTDDTFLAGFGTLDKQFEGCEDTLGRLCANARKNGYNPGINDVYMDNMARFFGDPQAFISTHSDARGHIKRVAEAEGMTVHGAVNVKGRQPEEDPHENCLPLAEDIVREEAQNRIKENPDLARGDMAELREQIIQDHGPQK